MIYIINENTNLVNEFKVSDINLLSRSFRTLPSREATTQERDDYLLQEAKNYKIAQIRANKKSFIYLPIEFDGSTFINSEIASTNLQGAYTFAEEPIEWIDIEGNTVILTKLQMKDLANLMITHRSSGYFQERDLIALVSNASTVDEVNNINIDFS